MTIPLTNGHTNRPPAYRHNRILIVCVVWIIGFRPRPNELTTLHHGVRAQLISTREPSWVPQIPPAASIYGRPTFHGRRGTLSVSHAPRKQRCTS
ncbi:hypothetical protein BV898_19595 [Hypsibius exemplaris]|uniref:Uncharacterized protein n=1 Tax=Hypsibius exemplaris TaxID=2072580 RepID=A0A9X6RPL3_HYPEX|nr:hypothetical protein BV898_19595 [Hypsibius exemplaris]